MTTSIEPYEITVTKSDSQIWAKATLDGDEVGSATGAIVRQSTDVVVCYVPNQRQADLVLAALNGWNQHLIDTANAGE